MFELENFNDVVLNKFSDTSGHILDLYISDSMQDMLDIDIKSEVATVVGGTNEFATLMNFDLPLLDFDPHQLIFNDETSSQSDDSLAGPQSGGASERSSSFLSSSSAFRGPSFGVLNCSDYLELEGSASCNAQATLGPGTLMNQCVNPNSVMPPAAPGNVFNKVLKSYTKSNVNQNGVVSGSRAGYNTNLNEISVNQTNSPCEKKSHLNFSPMRFNANGKQNPGVDHQSMESKLISDCTEKINMIRKNLANDLIMTNGRCAKMKGTPSRTIKSAMGSNNQEIHLSRAGKGSIELAVGGLNGLSFASAVTARSGSKSPSPAVVNGGGSAAVNGRYNSRGNLIHVHHHGTRNIVMAVAHNRASPVSVAAACTGNKLPSKLKTKHVASDFPKPAYSYSCLIAMALKNSRTGSLPVSEIYNFMCDHFPYFKTAPNGWKNSVRHNLSLNKCFEKIEKPTTNGGQRKGCLWAMNPTKVAKMDEEVQKWSRKDPSAIRRAMVYPENLSALERGDMKHGHYTNDEEEEDTDEDDEDGGPVDAEATLVHYADEDLEEDEFEEDESPSFVQSAIQPPPVPSLRRNVYRRPMMISQEMDVDDDDDDEDYQVDRHRASKKRRLVKYQQLQRDDSSRSMGRGLKQQQQRTQSKAYYHRIHQLKQEVPIKIESEELSEEDFLDDGIYMPSGRIQMAGHADKGFKHLNNSKGTPTIIGPDNLISSGSIDIEVADFYDEMDGTAIKREMEGCDVDSEGFLTDCEVKGMRLTAAGYSEAKHSQSSNRRKMTLVNRVL